jgi:hypothetical protein
MSLGENNNRSQFNEHGKKLQKEIHALLEAIRTSEWRPAVVCPIHTMGDKLQFKSHTGISLQSSDYYPALNAGPLCRENIRRQSVWF